jgi:hypothetical protein
MVQQLLTGPAPTIPPTLAGSGPTSALANGIINQNNATNLNELAGGYKRKRSRKLRRMGKRGSKRYKTKGRKISRRMRSRKLTRSSKHKRLYKGGAAGDPVPYSAPNSSNAAILNISEELALAHATSNTNSKLDGSASNAPTK